MIQKKYPRLSGAMATCVLTAAFAAIGCSDDLTAEVEGPGLALQATTWSYCANQGERCAFRGTRQVRFSADAKDYFGTFTDGVNCRGRNFGVSNRTSGARCFVATPSSTGSAGRPAAGSPGAAGAAAGSGGAGGAGGAGDPHSGHGTTGGAGGASASGTGPYIDTSALPARAAGSSKVQLQNTSEQPVASDGTGAFRTVCSFSHMLFDDPIVYPGQPGAAHLHAFFGNTGADANSTTSSISGSGNSTCRGGIANRSAYWVPALIAPDGKPVKPRSIEIYYKSGYYGVKASAVKPMPEGLRMIAGSAKSSSTQRYAYWGCHENYIGKPGSIPSCGSTDSVTMVVEFPQCWDGKNLDSADHTSHMAYAQNGCPASHPVPIPAITFNVLYAAPSGGTAGYRLASDMYSTSLPGGFSAHADWWNGWDPAVSKTFVERCVNPALDCHSHLLGDGRELY